MVEQEMGNNKKEYFVEWVTFDIFNIFILRNGLLWDSIWPTRTIQLVIRSVRHRNLYTFVQSVFGKEPLPTV